MSGTECKQGGNDRLSEEKVRETRLERLRNTNYREYWRKGGRGLNPNC